MKNFFKKKSKLPGSSEKVHSSSIPAEILKEYRQYAGIAENAPLCKAPFISMRLNRSGGVTPCCQNYHLDSLSGKGLLEVWNGEAYNRLREQIINNNLDSQCDFCKTNLLNKDFGNVLAANYNHFDVPDKGYPVYLDFSIDSQCNLQCVMCNGSLSSGHTPADGREALAWSYNEDFFNELEAIIPTLQFALFSGGEPFIIGSYYRIWEQIFALNPGMGVVITTNATVLDTRAKNIIEKGKCSFNVSIDSLEPAVYEGIRQHAVFDKTFENLRYLIDYTRRKNSTLSLSVCPMNMNWQTLPELVEFCRTEKIQLYLNLVTKPWHVALWPLAADELRRIAEFLRQNMPVVADGERNGVIEQMHILIHQIETWARQAGFFKQHLAEFIMPVTEFSGKFIAFIQHDPAYINGNAEDKKLFDRKIDEILNTFPEEFYTNFFLERLCKIPVSKILQEVVAEQCSTTAGNLCSIYYYSRGEAYSNLNIATQ